MSHIVRSMIAVGGLVALSAACGSTDDSSHGAPLEGSSGGSGSGADAGSAGLVSANDGGGGGDSGGGGNDAAGGADARPDGGSVAPPPVDCTQTPCDYVRAGAMGANDGTNWVNAYPSLPPNLLRGHTYFIAGGSYPGRTFDTPASGTDVIRIKGATTTDHGTGIGWDDTYSVDHAQALWTSGLTFNTSNWVFDGSTGANWSKTPSDYGFKIAPVGYALAVYNLNDTVSNVTLSHITSKAPPEDIEKLFISTNNSSKSVHQVTFSHCLVEGWENAVWATSAALPMNDWLVEYNVILNGVSTPAHHGEDINNNYGHFNDLVVRYNWFEGRRTGTGSIVVLNAPAGAYYIVGNVFKDMIGGDGIITGVHYPLSGVIANNTFIHVDNGYNNGLWIGHDVSAKVFDNVVYNSIAGIGANFTGTLDYNAYFDTTNTPTEPHGQVGSGNPFVNEAAGDVHLSAATTPGTAVSTTGNLDNTDVEGKTRGMDGTWDRGALEFVAP